jgi:orotidine-5'-phosphate decarboxylase
MFPLLVPGIGAQGGDLAAVMEAGLDSAGWGLVINAARSVLYAGSGEELPGRGAPGSQATCATRCGGCAGARSGNRLAF